jgi:acyl dehydratase
MNLPPLNEETGKPGTPLNPYEVTFDRAFVQGFLDKTGESADDYAVAGQPVVPPGIYLAAYGRLIHESFHYTAGVHVSSDMKVLAMAPVGTKATVSGEVLGLSERNGDKYVTFSVNVTDTTGTRLAEIEHVSIYALRPRT